LVTECGRNWCPNPDCPGNVGNPRPTGPDPKEENLVELVRLVRDMCAQAVTGKRYSENSCDAPADVRALDPRILLADARVRISAARGVAAHADEVEQAAHALEATRDQEVDGEGGAMEPTIPGGEDIVIAHEAKREDVRYLLDVVGECWPNLYSVSEGRASASAEVPRETFVYRDADAFQSWEAQGRTDENARNRVHFLFGDEQTRIVLEPGSDIEAPLRAALEGAEDGGPWQAQLRRILAQHAEEGAEGAADTQSLPHTVQVRHLEAARSWLDTDPPWTRREDVYAFGFADGEAFASDPLGFDEWMAAFIRLSPLGSTIQRLSQDEETRFAILHTIKAAWMHVALDQVDDCAADIDPARIEALEFEPCGTCKACVAAHAELQDAGVMSVTVVADPDENESPHD
jgi:hypothetical protein